MLRFAETPFTELPDKDDTYLVRKKKGGFYAHTYTTEGGWNTVKFYNRSVYANSALSPEEMQESYAYWLRPVEDETLTPWTYDQLIEELVVRCAMALDSKEQEMQANGSTQGSIDDACFYLNKSIEYLKRMMSMLEGEIN